jgi:AraC-like DNA-binding protein
MGEVISEGVHATPGGPLAGLIDRYDGYRQRGVAPARHLGLPAPYLTMIITLDEPMHLAQPVDPTLGPATFRALIGGLHAQPVEVVHHGAQSGIQLSINPLAARALFGVPAGELVDLDLHADAVIGTAADELWERLSSAGSWSSQFTVLDQMLQGRITAAGQVAVGSPAPVCAAWGLLNATGGTIGVAALAREVGWSPRRLEQAFAREIGMSPKQAARVIRFDRTRRALQVRAFGSASWGTGRATGDPLDLARLAADHGYHDQPHLIREFRSFTGLAPTRWLAQEFGNVQAGGVQET